MDREVMEQESPSKGILLMLKINHIVLSAVADIKRAGNGSTLFH